MRISAYFGAIGLCVACSALPAPAFAQPGGTPLGGTFKAIAVDPASPNTIYAGAFSGGVFKTTNGGATWASVSGPANGFSQFANVQAMVLDATHGGTVYVGTLNGIYKTVDGATSWTPVNNGLQSFFVQALAIDPTDPSTIYAGMSTGMYRSSDGAATWTPVSDLAGQNIFSITIDPNQPATLYAGTVSAGIFKTIDRGTTWIPINAGLTDVSIQSVTVDPSDSTVLYAGTNTRGVFRSVDGGTSWTAANNGLVLTVMSVRALAVNPSAPNTVYAATFGGVFKSNDKGLSWMPINTGISILSHTFAPGGFGLAFDPVNPAIVYVTTQSEGAIYKTSNGGASWTSINTGLTQTQISAIALDPHTPTTVYIATNTNAIYKSIDGGATWNESNLGFNTIVTLSLAIDPVTSTTVYAGASNGIFKSLDAGATWTRLNLNVPAQWLAINPVSPSIVYAGTSQFGVYKSSDGGGSWQPVNNGLTNLDVNVILVDPSNPAILYAATLGGGIFKSVDAAVSWTPINAGLTNTRVHAFAMNPATPTTLYAGTEAGMFKSVDGGASWATPSQAAFALGIVVGMAIDPTNASTLYAGHPGLDQVSKSSDGGVTWTPVGSGLPPMARFPFALVVDPATPTRVYAGTAAGTFVSTIGGGAWHAPGQPAPACTFSLAPTSADFTTSGGLGSFAVSTAAGCTWSASPSASWITILPGGSQGPGKVNFAVARNGEGARTGTITVGGQPFAIRQQPLICSATISPATAWFDAQGGYFSQTVTAPAACSQILTNFGIQNLPSWLSLVSRTPNGNSVTLVYFAFANTDGQRSATVTVAGQPFAVTQAATATPTACGATDVTSQVSIIPGGLNYIPFSTYIYTQTIVVTNNSGQPIPGPLFVVLIGVPNHQNYPNGVFVAGPTTSCFSPQGDALALMTGSGLLANGNTGSIFRFDAQSLGAPIRYTVKVLSGQPTR